MLAGRAPIIKEKEDAIRKLTAGIKEAIELFHSDSSMPQHVAEKYGQKYIIFKYFSIFSIFIFSYLDWKMQSSGMQEFT